MPRDDEGDEIWELMNIVKHVKSVSFSYIPSCEETYPLLANNWVETFEGNFVLKIRRKHGYTPKNQHIVDLRITPIANPENHMMGFALSSLNLT